MGNKLAVMKIKSNDLVMNLARHRYLLIVHTEGLCLQAAGVAFEMEEYKDFRRGSKGFTSHHTIERAQTTDEVRIQKIVERALKIIN